MQTIITHPHNPPCPLTPHTKEGDNAGTTKLQAAFSTAVNRAFFMPNSHPIAGLGILAISALQKLAGIMPNFKMGGLIAPNKRPHRGNKGSRLVAVVETRPPEHSGGQIQTKLQGGHAMSNTSHHGANAVITTSSYPSFTLKNADPNAIIEGFTALISPAGNCPYFLTVYLSTGQSSILLDPKDNQPLTFDTLEEINHFLFDQGIKTYAVDLHGLEWRVQA